MSDKYFPADANAQDDATRSGAEPQSVTHPATGMTVEGQREKVPNPGTGVEGGLTRLRAALRRAVADDDHSSRRNAFAKAGSRKERFLAMVAHSSIFVLPIYGPLLIMSLTASESPFVQEQGREALNYQVTIVIALIAAFLSLIVGLGLVTLLLPALLLLYIPPIIAVGKVGMNLGHRYRFTLRLVK